MLLCIVTAVVDDVVPAVGEPVVVVHRTAVVDDVVVVGVPVVVAVHRSGDPATRPHGAPREVNHQYRR